MGNAELTVQRTNAPADLPASAQRVQAAAQRLGLPIAVREMPASTRTAEEAAAVCGVTVGQIVKSLVFAGANSGAIYLLLVSGANRVNEAKVAGVIGEPLARPDAAKVRAATGYAIGGIPPFGHDQKLPTFFDADLLNHDVVWAAAGTPRAVFAVDPARLKDAVAAPVIAMT
jgi:prolyl-tRNA editing enzyme YbaK/EbsC (Cys-tRNA(Pro) deacylase)